MLLRDYVLSGCSEELEIEAKLARLESQMSAGAADEALLARYARAQAQLDARGGYRWRDRATEMAHGLGFAQETHCATSRHFIQVTGANTAALMAGQLAAVRAELKV